MTRGPAPFARIGEAKLRAVLADFYDRVFADVMIGFMFAGKDRAHLIEREYELTAKLLGAPGVAYRGLPLRTAHARHTIFGGQFERRLQILKETLADHDVDPEVRRVWLEHTLAFAKLTRAKHLVTFHHDPAHGDEDIDRLMAEARAAVRVACAVTVGAEGLAFELE